MGFFVEKKTFIHKDVYHIFKIEWSYLQTESDISAFFMKRLPISVPYWYIQLFWRWNYIAIFFLYSCMLVYIHEMCVNREYILYVDT